MTSSYQKITSKAVLYKLPANQNEAPEYRIIGYVPRSNEKVMKHALEAVKRMPIVVKGDSNVSSK